MKNKSGASGYRRGYAQTGTAVKKNSRKNKIYFRISVRG